MVVDKNSLRYSQRGLTLIEVLIAAIVLSIGLLGVFQLHIIAKKSSFESFQYSQVTAMASDIVERIRLNPTELLNYAGTYAGNGAGNPTLSMPAVQCNAAGGAPVNCNEAQMTAWDLYLWEQSLVGNLESAGSQSLGAPQDLTGCIYVSGNTLQVVVAWQGVNRVSDGATGHDSNRQSCGNASVYRRQVSVNAIITDNV